MPRLVLIDGNNLMHSMHVHAPIPHVGQETLVKIVERWARDGNDAVTIVFDGRPARRELERQLASKRIEVRFSAPATADDVIIAMIQRERDPAALAVVTDDTAIRHEARRRGCDHLNTIPFIAELFPSAPRSERSQPANIADKPEAVSNEEKKHWVDVFDDGIDDEPFEGSDAMLR